jgi:hypothetical protein
MRKPTKREVWHHNSLLGRTAMAKSAGQAVLQAKTTTAESQALANELVTITLHLYESLKIRSDQQKG